MFCCNLCTNIGSWLVRIWFIPILWKARFGQGFTWIWMLLFNLSPLCALMYLLFLCFCQYTINGGLTLVGIHWEVEVVIQKQRGFSLKFGTCYLWQFPVSSLLVVCPVVLYWKISNHFVQLQNQWAHKPSSPAWVSVCVLFATKVAIIHRKM